ncbi:MAG: hypothetical protein K2X94_00145 [Amoebophilaceae bacterium]|nr:hypothetical protein [Amoebophilaceae bacterium]
MFTVNVKLSKPMPMVWVSLPLLTMGGYGDSSLSSPGSKATAFSAANTTRVAVPIDKPLLFCFDFGKTLIKGSLTVNLNNCRKELA